MHTTDFERPKTTTMRQPASYEGYSLTTGKDVSYFIRHMSEYGFRNYAPGVGKWFSRDPIGESDGAGLYVLVGNDPVDMIDFQGLWRWPWTKCCGDKTYNVFKQCCCEKNGKKHVIDDVLILTQFKHCCTYGRRGKTWLPWHCWIEYPGGSAGFRRASPGFEPPPPGMVTTPELDRYLGDATKQCSPLKLSPCMFDFDKVNECIKTRVAKDKLHPPAYKVAEFDCRNWARSVLDDCTAWKETNETLGCTVLSK